MLDCFSHVSGFVVSTLGLSSVTCSAGTLCGIVGVPVVAVLLGNIRGALVGGVGCLNRASVSLSIFVVFSARSLDLAECSTNAAVCSPNVLAVVGRTIVVAVLVLGVSSTSFPTL